MEYLIFGVVIGVVFGLISIGVAGSKDVSPAGAFFLGFFLGPIGLIVVAVMPRQLPAQMDKEGQGRATKKCPSCAEYVALEARKCRFCGHQFSEAELKASFDTYDRLVQEAEERRAEENATYRAQQEEVQKTHKIVAFALASLTLVLVLMIMA